MTTCTKWKGRNQSLPYPQPWEYVKDHLFKGNKVPGTFIEIGATDGVDGSNTHFFESEWGWSGLCIEPNPVMYNLLKDNRPNVINCAVGDVNEKKTFCVVHGYASPLSCIVEYASEQHMNRIDMEVSRHGGQKEYIEIEVRTLDDILTQYGINHIDYLSIDVEGAEESVLSNINFASCSVDVITAEHNEYDQSNVNKILSENNFDFKTKICADNVYVRRGFYK